VNRRSGRPGRFGWVALCATVLLTVPLAGAGASVTASTPGAATTNFPLTSFPGDITAGPDGALWFTDFGSSADPERSIRRITTAGVITTFTDAAIGSPGGITAGPDGALWFTIQNGNAFSIGRITTTGTVTTYTDPSLARPRAITTGPDGALWFTNGGVFDNGIPTADKGSIGRITTTGTITNYRDPSIVYPGGITAGPDGALWFTNTGGSSAADKGSIGRITTTGTVTNYTSSNIDYPEAITAGPDGALWFTNTSDGAPRTPYSIGRITTTGTVTDYTDPSIALPAGITAGPDGALWFTNLHSESIGRITTSGTITNNTDGLPFGSGDGPLAITAGPDGALWVANGGNTNGGSIMRITTGLTASAPRSPSAAPNVGRATVHWTVPLNNGGAPITGYEVTPYIGDAAQTPQTFDTTATTETVTGLTAGTTYQFKIAAQSARGLGAWSAFTYPVAIGPPSSWKIVASPNPTGRYRGGVLNSVSCTSTTNCFAVGLGDATGQNQPLAEQWNGTHWTIVPTPAPANGGEGVLNAVSCTSTTNCLAVGGGDAGTLAERWNGKHWSTTPITTGPELFGVSCTSASLCYAVGNGGAGAAVIERWNGKKWSVVSSPASVGYLTGVSCTSAKDCGAVGYGLEHWNGTKWSTVAGPHPTNFFAGPLSAVSCPRKANCFAVGQGQTATEQAQTWTAHWDGTSWAPVPSPNPADFFGGILSGVSCAGATNCIAVGVNESGSTYGRKTEGGTLIEQWNGTRWSIVGSPNPAGLGTLNSVSCTTATNCVAVGFSGAGKTLIEHS
jgi:virginiamycin B lyase